ncbi:MAG: hypothetical protein LBJ12_04905 [Oscillospiraceae bacterium]|nr:hypothetical protein [Oscillospiraceae bacterium]
MMVVHLYMKHTDKICFWDIATIVGYFYGVSELVDIYIYLLLAECKDTARNRRIDGITSILYVLTEHYP